MFSAENFGNLLVGEALQALEQGQRLYREDLHCHEIGVANLTALTRNMNRGKDQQPIAATEFYAFSSQEKFDAITADTVFSLAQDKKIEEWLLKFIPIEELRKCKGDGLNLGKPRMLMGTAIALFCPSIQSSNISSKLIVYDDIYHWGFQWLKDVDTGEEIEVFVPPYDGDLNWQKDWQGFLREV